ncbi:MAG: S9 family peptidase, partial [Gemmatimonadetes bacterium]|nr:S9 family peptidase [Gemmatimonadota bacterium]
MLSLFGTLALAALVQASVAPQEGGTRTPSAAAARPLAVEDYYRLRSVGSPRMSPDGRWVAYTVSTPVEETNGNATASWLVRADGSAAPVRLTREGADVADPRWGPDGRLRVREG